MAIVTGRSYKLTFTLRGPRDDMKPDEALAHAQRLLGIAMTYEEVAEDESNVATPVFTEFMDMAWGYIEHARTYRRNRRHRARPAVEGGNVRALRPAKKAGA